MFFWKRISKLNGVDEFASEIGYTSECNMGVYFNGTKICLYYQSEHL